MSVRVSVFNYITTYDHQAALPRTGAAAAAVDSSKEKTWVSEGSTWLHHQQPGMFKDLCHGRQRACVRGPAETMVTLRNNSWIIIRSVKGGHRTKMVTLGCKKCSCCGGNIALKVELYPARLGQSQMISSSKCILKV